MWARNSRYCQLSTIAYLRDFGEIAAHQGEMVVAIDLANVADPLQRRLVADVTAQGVAGVGRIDDHAAAAQDLDRLAYEALLRRDRV